MFCFENIVNLKITCYCPPPPQPHKKMSMFHESLRCKSSLYNLLNIHKRLYTTYVYMRQKKIHPFCVFKTTYGKKFSNQLRQALFADYSMIIRQSWTEIQRGIAFYM